MSSQPPRLQHHQPRIETRAARPYLAITASATDEAGFRATVDRDMPAVFRRAAERGLTPAGPPFLRYLVVDERVLPDDGPPAATFESALPLAAPAEDDELVHGGELPAGRWVVALHRGGYSGLGGLHAIVHAWAREEGHVVARRPAGSRTAFGGSVEHFLIGPPDDPDPWAWETEVGYLLED